LGINRVANLKLILAGILAREKRVVYTMSYGQGGRADTMNNLKQARASKKFEMRIATKAWEGTH